MSSSCKAPTQHAVLHGYHPKGKTKPWEAGSLPLASFQNYDRISVILVFPEHGVLQFLTACVKQTFLHVAGMIFFWAITSKAFFITLLKILFLNSDLDFDENKQT